MQNDICMCDASLNMIKMSPFRFRIAISFLLTLCLGIAGCRGYADKDFELTKEEQRLFAPFKEGDTTYYLSGTGEVDTMIIHRVETDQKREPGTLTTWDAIEGDLYSDVQAFNVVSVRVVILPENYYLEPWPTMKAGPREIDFPPLCRISIWPQQKRRTYSFCFRRFQAYGRDSIGEYHMDTTYINGTPIANYYFIAGNRETSEAPQDISDIYWSIEKGLIAYRNHQGKYWLRSSL